VNCFPELTCSIYADGELPEDEAREVAAHLIACRRCRDLVEALRAENRLLLAVVEEMDEAEEVSAVPAPAAPRRRLARVALPALAALVALRAGLAWLGGWLPTGPADWLNPVSGTGLRRILFSNAYRFVETGYAALASVVPLLCGLTVALALMAGLVLLLRRHPVQATGALALALLLVLPAPVSAMESRTGEEVTVPAGETIDGSLALAGDTVHMDGVVDGDLFLFARRASVRGTVRGNAYIFAQNLDLEGSVEGNLHGWVQWSRIAGRVAQSAYIGTMELQLAPEGTIGRDVVIFAEGGTLEGSVGRDVLAMSDHLELLGSVGRNLKANAARISLAESARLGGDLTAIVPDADGLRVAPGAVVGGETRVEPPEDEAKKRSRYLQPRFYGWRFVHLVGAYLVGLLLLWLFPGLARTGMETAGAVARTLGLGFLVLVAAPVVVVLAAVTIVGLPLALLGAVLYGAALYLAKIAAAGWLGGLLMRPEAGDRARLALALLAGLGVVYVAISLPFLGWLIHLALVVLGMGMLLIWAWSALRARGAVQEAGQV